MLSVKIKTIVLVWKCTHAFVRADRALSCAFGNISILSGVWVFFQKHPWMLCFKQVLTKLALIWTIDGWLITWPIFVCLLFALRWRHNDHAGVSNHQPHGCLLNRLFRRKSKKTSKLRVTGLCAGNSPGTGEFPAQMASYAENVSIWWRHHVSMLGFNRWF